MKYIRAGAPGPPRPRAPGPRRPGGPGPRGPWAIGATPSVSATGYLKGKKNIWPGVFLAMCHYWEVVEISAVSCQNYLFYRKIREIIR